MSETDDTDVLLLIPPNFFLVQTSGSEDSLLESSRTVVHKPLSCTAQVLGKLVNQVHTIENRLESLETSDVSLGVKSKCTVKTLDSTDSFDNSIDRKCFTFPRRRRRKVPRQAKRKRSLTSLDSASTRIKSIPPLKLNEDSLKNTDYTNDTRSMDGDLSSIISTPSKKNDKLLLNEIDEFLTKVETYESPDSKYKEQDHSFNPDDIIKATGNYISQKIDSNYESDQVKLPSGRVVSSNVLDKYIYLVKSNPGSSHSDKQPLTCDYKDYKPQHSESNISHSYELLKSEPNQETRSPIIRKLNFAEKEIQPTSTPKKPLSTHSYVDSFRPTSNKIYDRATKVLEQYKAQSSWNLTSDTYSSPQKEDFKMSQTRLYSDSPQKDDFKIPQTRHYSDSSQKDDFKMPQMRPYLDMKDGSKLHHKLLDSIDTDLLSLSELWGEKGERDRAERADSIKLEEEKLKREHCESIIQQLQKKVLEQQEKLAVAIKVDRAKDVAISKLKEAWLRLTGSLDKAEERHRAALNKMVKEVDNFRAVADDAQKKTTHFETELYKALDLAHDYQEKCKEIANEKKTLQEQMEKALSARQEVIDSKDKEIQVLKENYETVMRLNKQSTDCVKNLEEMLEKEKSDHDQTKEKAIELNRKQSAHNGETSLLMQERDVLRDKVNEERARCNILEQQLSEKQNQMSELLRRCDTLECEAKSFRKHMELQKCELKTHYQKQLEDAVMSKLQEFQQQLDVAEREMEADARNKENAIVDTFNKQITRIEEQHKLEVNVLEEKQREEIKLYRLQLAQTSEKIGLLEGKLSSYRQRRGELAAQLHGVMEAQWRQALTILTHPRHRGGDTTRPDTASTILEGAGGDVAGAGAHGEYGAAVPPLTLPGFNLNRVTDKFSTAVDTLSDNELQHYVKLLLTKPVNSALQLQSPPEPPPRDRERDPGGDEPTSDRPDRSRGDKPRRGLNMNKPPWKS